MEILIATNKDFETVKYIIHTTIKEIYPQYYPKGVVEFFLSYHSSQNIKKALLNNEIFLDSSLPAYNLYLNRGYKPISFHKVLTKNQHYLCYNTMKLEKIKSR